MIGFYDDQKFGEQRKILGYSDASEPPSGPRVTVTGGSAGLSRTFLVQVQVEPPSVRASGLGCVFTIAQMFKFVIRVLKSH